jgi:hypothetical protein
MLKLYVKHLQKIYSTRFSNQKVEALKDVVMYVAKKPDDENTRDINYYYYTLQRMFKMRLVETLDVSIYNKVREFLGGEILKNNDLKLVLNKKNN